MRKLQILIVIVVLTACARVAVCEMDGGFVVCFSVI